MRIDTDGVIYTQRIDDQTLQVLKLEAQHKKQENEVMTLRETLRECQERAALLLEKFKNAILENNVLSLAVKQLESECYQNHTQ